MNQEKAQHLGLHQMLFQGKDGYQETTNSHAKSAMGPGGGDSIKTQTQEHYVLGVNIFPHNWKSMPGSGSYLFPNVHLRLMLKYLQLDPWRLRLNLWRFALESPPSFRRYNNSLCRSISLVTLTAWQTPLITGISRGRPDNVPGQAPWAGLGGPCSPAESTVPPSD